MKQRTYNLCLAGIGTLALTAVIWITVAFAPGEKRKEPSAPTTSAHGEARGVVDATNSQELSPQEIRGHKPRDASNGDNLVRLRSGQVLALVNNEPVEARDLSPLGKGDEENVMTREEYSSRLQRAVDMEIILQAAFAEKIELTEAQKIRVDGIAGGDKAEMEHYRKFGLTWRSTGPEHVEFEKRLLGAQLLEQNLVARKSELKPSSDPEIQSRYEEARSQLLAQLQQQAEINILAPAKTR